MNCPLNCARVITDSDGYTNIRKSNSVNWKLQVKLWIGKYSLIGKQMIIGILCKLQKGIKGYVHKTESRIKPVEERNEQKQIL